MTTDPALTADYAVNPFRSIHNLVVFSGRDWGANAQDSSLYAIVAGWGNSDDPEDMEAWDEQAARWRWDGPTVARLKEMHAVFEQALTGASSSVDPDGIPTEGEPS